MADYPWDLSDKPLSIDQEAIDRARHHAHQTATAAREEALAHIRGTFSTPSYFKGHKVIMLSQLNIIQIDDNYFTPEEVLFTHERAIEMYAQAEDAIQQLSLGNAEGCLEILKTLRKE